MMSKARSASLVDAAKPLLFRVQEYDEKDIFRNIGCRIALVL